MKKRKRHSDDVLARMLTSIGRRVKPAPIPATPAPMLCTLVDEAFDDPAWIFEPKFDGLRVLGKFDGKDLTLLSRNHLSQNFQFPDIVTALRASLRRPAIVDGEVVCLDERGHSSFRSLQQRFHLTDPKEVEERSKQYPAYICLFDVLYVDKYDVTSLSLKDRKEILHEIVTWSDRVRWTEYRPEHGRKEWHEACRAGDEGVIGKRLDSSYVPARSAAWVKIKCVGRQEFVIGGFTEPQRTRVGLGALLVGYYSDDGQRFTYAGKVGTGFTHKVLLDLRERLDELRQNQSPFDQGQPPRSRGTHWVGPKLVAEIAFAEWTQNGLLRQPRFEGLRPDKKPKECRREQPQPAAVADVHKHLGNGQEHLGNGQAAGPLTGGAKMDLETYKAKRNFRKTPEPAAKPGKSHRRPLFVVQEHHASRLHYDIRLEADGVLKSWAVPKEPSMDPAQKRLAVQVEDHPLGYADFEGTIPEGQYGAGEVTIWDKGTYENLLAEKPVPQSVAEGVAAGHLEIELHGKRLQGRFALIHMQGRMRGKNNWLLIKMKDAAARKESTNGTPRARRSAARTRRPTAPVRRRASRPSTNGIQFTHQDKVLFPGSGVTKGEVIDFYRQIAPHLLPFLRDRPATLERLPEGLGNGKATPHFWQKNTPASYPDWIPRADLPTEQGKTVSYVLVNDEETLLYLVNLGTLTFHVWLSRVADLDRPDFVLFDLDRGEAAFSDVVAVAQNLHDILHRAGRAAYVKTSGKTGLHILVPWQDQGGYEEARGWASAIADQVVQVMPDQATTERLKADRGGRVYVDVLQNAKGHHAVPPYVLRADPSAAVSTPLDWREVTAKLDPADFNLKTIFRRLARQKRDPLADFMKSIKANGKRK